MTGLNLGNDDLGKLRVMDIHIDTMRDEDWPQVSEIYRQGSATGNATFESELPSWDKWDQAHVRECRLVARGMNQILGWAALSPVSARRVYAGVNDVSVYVAEEARGRGMGKTLLTVLVEKSESRGIWTLQAGIFPENAASIALHKVCGFREVGIRRRLGRLGDVWRDVVLLERRSNKAGV